MSKTIKSNWIVKNSEKKDFNDVCVEVSDLSGIPVKDLSNHLFEMGKPGVYMFLNVNTDKFDYIGKTTESFSRRVMENLSDYDRYNSLMKHVKKALGTQNTRRATDFINENYNVIILPLPVRRNYEHKQKVDKNIVNKLESGLIRQFMPMFNKRGNPRHATRKGLV